MSSTPKILMPPVVRPSRVKQIEKIIVIIQEEERRRQPKHSKAHSHSGKSHAHK